MDTINTEKAMVFKSNMEVIALTTALADARAAIQVSSREIREAIRSLQRRTDRGQEGDLSNLSATQKACDGMLAVVQVHLAYLVRSDSLLLVPGTNAENSGTPSPSSFTNGRTSCCGLLGSYETV
jgi:hypothetical protein